MSQTLEQQQDQRQKDMEANRQQGVIPWRNNLPQSDEVWEVVDGYHHLTPKPGSKERIKLGPGNRFHPTVEQVEHATERGGLLRGNKMRRLSATDMAGIGRSQDTSRKTWSPGADFGVRALPMSDTALKLALGTLDENDFQGIEPEGAEGVYTVRQVRSMIEAKTREAESADGSE